MLLLPELFPELFLMSEPPESSPELFPLLSPELPESLPELFPLLLPKFPELLLQHWQQQLQQLLCSRFLSFNWLLEIFFYIFCHCKKKH